MDGIAGRIIDRFAGEKLESGRLDGGGLSAKNVRDILSVIKMTLDIAWEDGIITRKISFAKPRLKAKTIDILSPKEQSLILELACSGDLREFGYYLCLQTGLRIGEICALRWNDIDFENRLMKVDRTLLRISDTDGTDKKTKVIFDSAAGRFASGAFIQKKLRCIRGRLSSDRNRRLYRAAALHLQLQAVSR